MDKNHDANHADHCLLTSSRWIHCCCRRIRQEQDAAEGGGGGDSGVESSAV